MVRGFHVLFLASCALRRRPVWLLHAYYLYTLMPSKSCTGAGGVRCIEPLFGPGERVDVHVFVQEVPHAHAHSHSHAHAHSRWPGIAHGLKPSVICNISMSSVEEIDASVQIPAVVRRRRRFARHIVLMRNGVAVERFDGTPDGYMDGVHEHDADAPHVTVPRTRQPAPKHPVIDSDSDGDGGGGGAPAATATAATAATATAAVARGRA